MTVHNCPNCGVAEGCLHLPGCASLAGTVVGESTPEETPSRTSGLMPPWQPGQSGNPAGRPKGARNKLSDDFFKALMEDFETNGIAAIQAMRNDRPGDYAKMIASLQTKETDNKHEGEFDITEVRWSIRDPGR